MARTIGIAAFADADELDVVGPWGRRSPAASGGCGTGTWLQPGRLPRFDMALSLVGQLYAPAHARATQRYIQYEPAPPYAADV